MFQLIATDVEQQLSLHVIIFLTLLNPPCLLVGRTNSIISNVPQEKLWAVRIGLIIYNFCPILGTLQISK